MASCVRLCVLLAASMAASLGSARPAGAETPAELMAELAGRDADGKGPHLGVMVVVEGRGVILSHQARVPRAAASAIKTAVALDLLALRGRELDEVPPGVAALLDPGVHPAMSGFTGPQLATCRSELVGRSYRELARIMMGRVEATNEAYNAACNLVMIKLGGPEAITRRLHALDPALAGIEIDRYMQLWNGDGDNHATPEALASLYRMTAAGHVPGLGSREVGFLRELLLDDEPHGPDRMFEKDGTLFPHPMVRVHAGYLERARGDVIYVVMGEVPEPPSEDAAGVFLRLLQDVDAVAVRCRALGDTDRP